MQDNILPKPGVFSPKGTFSAFPGMRWHPETGECKTFATAAEMPEGWLDCHPSSLPEKPADQAMTRKEITAALNDGGISFKPTASTASLYDLLVDSLKTALVTAEIYFDSASTDARALMGLFPKA